MLEQSQLLIEPFGADGMRGIAQAADGMRLGFAVWRPAEGPWWWPGAPVLTVCEEVDAPVVFTVRRRWTWPPRREVNDADGKHVGDLVGDWVRDYTGRRVATRIRHAEQRLLVGVDDMALATYRVEVNGVHFAFAPAAEGEPFLRMLLLAAAMLDDP